MFDFGFKKWLTPIFVKFIYSIFCLLILIALLLTVIWLYVDRKYWQACLTFVFGAIAAIILIFIVRVILECALALVRNMQSTTVLAHQAWSRVEKQAEPVQERPMASAVPFRSPATPQGKSRSYKNLQAAEHPAVDGMGTDGFYYHNGLPYRQVVVNTSKGPQQQWQPVIRR